MGCQRKLRVLVVIVALFAPLTLGAATPDILLPNPFAVELPAASSSLAADDAKMRQLLARVQAGGDRVSAMFPRDRLGPGAWRIILSAWSGVAGERPAARREAVLLILPHGMTPVGNTGYAGGVHVTSDAGGFVHMVWTDAWRGGAREGAMYRRGVVAPDGSMHFDTGVLDLAANRGNWTAQPTLAAAGDTIHFAWQAEGTIRYRSLTRTANAWQWSDAVDTKVPAPGREQGPAISAGADVVAVLSEDGHYLASHDGGRSWTTETLPFAHGTGLLRAVSLVHRLAGASVQSGPCSTLRLVQRRAPQEWQALPGPVSANSECSGDAVGVLQGPAGGMYAVWQAAGTDDASGVQAYIAWRPVNGPWLPGLRLVAQDPIHGLGNSFVSGLAMDHGTALVLTSFTLHSGWRYRGNDSELELFHDGAQRGVPLPVTSFIRTAMTQAEPAVALSAAALSLAPTLTHTADGRIWADILMVLNPTSVAAPGVVVWQHLELTGWLRAGQ